MIHLPPLPGSTLYTGQPFDQIVELAVNDAQALRGAGFVAGIIQNSHDPPYTTTVQPETIAFWRRLVGKFGA
jgi:predicted TIM-barrel enzyme